MKSPKTMTPEELVEAGQIGTLLLTTTRNAGRARSSQRQAAAQWWEETLQRIVTKSFQQAER